jgi:WD40 repeat protein
MEVMEDGEKYIAIDKSTKFDYEFFIFCFISQECELGNEGDIPPPMVQGVVHDIAWAPAMGRSYHLIATATREPNFKIHTLNRNPDGSLKFVSTHVELVSSPVWRLAWNATGTVLSTSSEDGSLQLWRKDFAGSWKSVQSLPLNHEIKSFYS